MSKEYQSAYLKVEDNIIEEIEKLEGFDPDNLNFDQINFIVNEIKTTQEELYIIL